MAVSMIRGLRVGAASPRLFVRATAFCLLSSVLCLLNAEELPDPTRPPASLATLGAAPGHGATGSQPSGLQSTIISGSRRAAIIDGKTVELGAKHGNARLIEVNEGSVVLRGEQTRRVLTLFPDVKMTQREIKDVSPESVVQPETQKANQMMHEEKK
ncbi:MAG: hypothetical protein HY935_02345 [Nitrosomonadales bacterium]|nr:hypothetical protein [Nitrosomonadales bacterium]